MKPSDIRSALERRGNHLNRGIGIELSIKKAKAKNIIIDLYIAEIFSWFNGFQEGALDPGSGIRIWSLEEVLEQVQERPHRTPFADFLINSNEYTLSLEDANASICMDDSNEVVAKSLPDFFNQLVSGSFDF